MPNKFTKVFVLVSLPSSAVGLSENCDCGIPWSYSLALLVILIFPIGRKITYFRLCT